MWPPWLTDLIVTQWGFAVPLVYAAATYSAFHWLDTKASEPAKHALTERLQSAPPDREKVANFTVEIFDRIYGAPLLRWRALLRSATITFVLCVVIWFQAGITGSFLRSEYKIVAASLILNVIADYISLFFIRTLLVAAHRRPILGLVAAFVVGSAIVYVSYIARGFLYFALAVGLIASVAVMRLFLDANFNPLAGGIISQQGSLTLPAVVVHLWLPLLALAVIATQALGWLLRAAERMQWFLDQGQQHPFQAVGYVAALIVFFVSAGLQLISR